MEDAKGLTVYKGLQWIEHRHSFFNFVKAFMAKATSVKLVPKTKIKRTVN